MSPLIAGRVEQPPGAAPEAVQDARVSGVTRPPQQEATRGPAIFVWGTWALMLLGGLAYALAYGNLLPYMDDWNWVPAMAGQQPLTLAWLWEQNDDHRVPLSKLLLVALYRLGGGDFRAGLVANVLLAAVLAFAMVRAATRLRGRMSYLDALFPLVLMNLGSEIFLLGLGVSVIPSTMLVGLLLLLFVRQGARLTFGATLLAGLGILALALVGTTGLVLVPALALWLVYAGWLCWRAPGPYRRWKAALIWGLAAAALLLVPLYFVNYHTVDHQPDSDGRFRPDWWAALQTSLEFVSVSFGEAVAGYLLGEQPVPPLLGLGIVLLGFVSTVLLVRVWRRQPRERARVLGFLCLLGGMACLALGIGVARAGWGAGAGYVPRYGVLAAPVLPCLYFIWAVYGAPSSRRLIHLGLFVPALLLLPFNAWVLVLSGKERRQVTEAVRQELQAGTSSDDIARTYGHGLNDQYRWRKLAAYLRLLRQSGAGPLRSFPYDPAQDIPGPAETDEEREYKEQVRRVKEAARTAVPPGAVVLIVSQEDPDVVQLEGRTGWHFPQTRGGHAAKFRDLDLDGPRAIAHLEELRHKGADYLLFPKDTYWLLEDYPDFRRHLVTHYQRVAGPSEDICILFALR